MPDSLKQLESDVVACRRCERLVAHREQIATVRKKAYADQEYWGRAVPGFGVRRARLVMIGLAPGAHGSNRTGRVFTGDASGDFLYPTLHRHGFATQAESTSRKDGLKLKDAFITAVARCAPPGNKPTGGEINNCRDYLVRELTLLRQARVYLCFGKIAFDGLIRTLRDVGVTVSGSEKARFSHGAEYMLSDGRTLLGTYHPSRQNTNTGRLTQPMFDAIFVRATELIDE